MIFDSHIKVGVNYKGEDHSIDDYMELMSQNNIEGALICPHKPISYRVADGNDYIEEIIKTHPDMFFGAVRVNPWDRTNALNEVLRRTAASSNFKAIYLHPWEENFQCNDEIVFPILELAQEKNLSVVIEAGYPWVSHISQIGDLARMFPRVKILATNAGQLDLSGFTLGDVSYVLMEYDNIFLGTASAVGAEWLVDMERIVAPHRVLFESNYPINDVYMEIFRIAQSYLNDEEKENVFSKNSYNFLDL